MADEPSGPPGRPRQQKDAALLEAVRARWREVVLRARPVDNTATLNLDVYKTVRLDLGGDTTARADLGGDSTGRLDPDTVAVKPSVPQQRPGPQNDPSLHDTVRAHWREVINRARPVDTTARLDVGVEPTARLILVLRPLRRSSLRLRRGGRDSRTMLHRTNLCGRAGAAVTWFAARDRLTALHDFGGAPVRPSVPPRRPRQQNDAALQEAVTVDEATLWRLRIKRTAVAFGAVLLFVALVVFSGHPFGGDDQPAPQPSVPSASGDGSSAATRRTATIGSGFTWNPGCASRRLIRRRTATGPRRASVFRRR